MCCVVRKAAHRLIRKYWLQLDSAGLDFNQTGGSSLVVLSARLRRILKVARPHRRFGQRDRINVDLFPKQCVPAFGSEICGEKRADATKTGVSQQILTERLFISAEAMPRQVRV